MFRYKTYIIFSRLCDCLDIQCCVVNLNSENILIDFLRPFATSTPGEVLLDCCLYSLLLPSPNVDVRFSVGAKIQSQQFPILQTFQRHSMALAIDGTKQTIGNNKKEIFCDVPDLMARWMRTQRSGNICHSKPPHRGMFCNNYLHELTHKV